MKKILLVVLLMGCAVFPPQPSAITGRVPSTPSEVVNLEEVPDGSEFCLVRIWNDLHVPQNVVLKTPNIIFEQVVLGGQRYIGHILKCESSPVILEYWTEQSDSMAVLTHETLRPGRLTLFIVGELPER